MRVAFLHDWSWLAAWLAEGLRSTGMDEVWTAAARPSDVGDDARNIDWPKLLGGLRTFDPDLIVVGEFPARIPRVALATARLAAINVHTSLLPRYRGAMPVFWAIRNGEHATGVTIHHLTDRFDAGPVVAQTDVPIASGDDSLTLSIRLARAARPLLDDVLNRYRQGERPAGNEQDNSVATRAPAIRSEHLRIQWPETADSIDRVIRAAYPVLEAHTSFRGQRLVIRTSTVTGVLGLTAGSLCVNRESQGLLVGTGSTAIEIRTVQLQSGRPISGSSFASLLGILDGESFE